MTDRFETLRRMVESRPDDTRARLGLALEYERMEQWDDVIVQLREYLTRADDQGSAYGRLARALLQLGRVEEARIEYGRGIEAANRHRHPTMAAEFEEALEEL